VADLSYEAVVQLLRTAGCVFAEDEAQLLLAAHCDGVELERMVEQRCAGIPLEHVLGWAELAGVRVSVDRGVFVPRPRSELLVACAIELVRRGDTVVDLCCGSGAVAAAILDRVGALDLHAADIDPAAVACARRNLEARGARVHLGDLDDPLPRALRRRVHVMVANAPYVPTAAIALLPREARDHEPLVALEGGHDGLDLHRRIATCAPTWLAPGGHLLIETSEDLAPRTAALMTAAGLAARIVRSDEHDATVAIGTLCAPERDRHGT
jgi:release factor glutamine methyltransferase